MNKRGIEATCGSPYSPLSVPDFLTPFSRGSRFLRLSHWVQSNLFVKRELRQMEVYAATMMLGGAGTSGNVLEVQVLTMVPEVQASMAVLEVQAPMAVPEVQALMMCWIYRH